MGSEAAPAAGTPAQGRAGVLLVNLGTPSAPTPSAVRRFLREFLSDPRVVEIPRLVWLPILYGFVLTTRPAKSAAKYREIWTADGSPLAVHTARQAKMLAGYLGEKIATRPSPPVEFGMRYGEPSISAALGRLGAAGCTRIVVIPLYPQYAASTTASTRDALDAALALPVVGSGPSPAICFIEQFHADAGYIDALAGRVMQHWECNGRLPAHGAKLVMSFHGIPKRSVDRGDPYEIQCLATARLLAARLGLEPGAWIATFQSRFGRAEWLQPYTEPTLVLLAKEGVTRVDLICPGFVSDCLETLEELGLGAKAAFLGAGGRQFHLLECLNEDPAWIAALVAMVQRELATGEWTG